LNVRGFYSVKTYRYSFLAPLSWSKFWLGS